MELEKLTGSKVKITHEINPNQFEEALNKAFDKEQKTVEVKGWRKGHVPRSVYEKQFGIESLYYTAITNLADELYFPSIMENKLNIAGDPEIDIDITKIKRGEPFKLAFIIPLFPEVILGEYKGITAKAKNTKVSKKEVDDEINKMLSSAAVSVTKENGEIAKGDVVIFDFKGFKDGVEFPGGSSENYELEIGSNQFIPGFEDQMLGLKSNEEKTITVTFPSDYHEKSLAGALTEFKVKIHEVKTKQMPELNDEFVQTQKIDNVNTVLELQNHFKKNLEAQKEQTETERLTTELVDEVCKNAKMEIPDSMLEKAKNDEIEELKQNIKNQYNLDLEMFKKLANIEGDEFEKQMVERSKKRLTETLVLEAIIKQEGIKAEQTEIDEFKKNNNLNTSNEQIAFHLEINKVIDLLVANAILK